MSSSFLKINRKRNKKVEGKSAADKPSKEVKAESSNNSKFNNRKRKAKNFAMTTPAIHDVPVNQQYPPKQTKKSFVGEYPICTTCGYHHASNRRCRVCTNSRMYGHIANYCRNGPIVQQGQPAPQLNQPPVAPAPALTNGRGCYECGDPNHFRNKCPKLGGGTSKGLQANELSNLLFNLRNQAPKSRPSRLQNCRSKSTQMQTIAVLLCYTDEAGLCWSYDENVHAANKFAGKHRRVLLSASNSQISNGCPDVGTPYPSTVMPYTVTGVIVFVLQQNDHLMFEIKGDDIFVEHTLSLAEALCNLDFIALMVIQAMLGSWNKSAGASKHME
ncbi:hypothetical protein E3N88_28970 [Mikania micrantha]|uniref:CCHC-type domain-containing protein n=1 Tax=Mikania micrantha TaxID=192012 RepID=A0A5N6N115_9ASTR|nr:hypothetical protein E3N88_28970 [Mikania micrantha]